ncbi:2OG-Fe(II) oxygenase superfamily protein [compost metagenome]
MGEFYALHRDNPQQKNDRIISTVYYLHAEWQEDWGGQLRLQDKNEKWHIVNPDPNRLVIFQSNLLHEVLTSKQQRLSITAWLRSGNSIWV